MENIYVLSIAIPAYGYPEALKRNVNNLLMIEREDIEIVVVDNDPTGEQIGEYANSIKDLRFHYYKNETNIGRGANIAKAVEMAKSDYVLLASCDDMVRTDSIDSIIDSLHDNPKCALLMGKIRTDQGNYYGYNGEEKIYKKGYEALSVTPRMGVLYPFVVNKKYLDFDELYSKEEVYMQTRIAYTVAGQGDFVGIQDIVADVIDQISYYEDGTKLECYSIGDWGKIKKTWNLGKCYYSPDARGRQLIGDIETIEQFNIRHSHKMRLVDKYVNQALLLSLQYVVACHDPNDIKNAGSIGFLTCDEALDLFRDEVEYFFKKRADEGLYYYYGTFLDKLNNERIILRKIRDIKTRILDKAEVYVYDTGNTNASELLSYVLGVMTIVISNTCEKKLALVSGEYDDDIESTLLTMGAEEVIFFDKMPQYLMMVWIEELKSEDKNAFGSYSKVLM